MTVLYSCDQCGLRRVPCEVPDREPQQDIVAWMESALQLLAEDHAACSPVCSATGFAEVLIPMTGRTHIGGPMEH